MEIIPANGALYPVCVQKGQLPDVILRQWRGVSYRRHERPDGVYYTFPFWHAERVSTLLGVPTSEFGKKLFDGLRAQRETIEQIRAGKSPLLDLAPKYFYQHQKICFAIALVSKSYGFFLEPGLGKTAIMIEIMRLAQRRVPTLVICPVPLIRNAWLEELALRAPELTSANLNENPELCKFDFDVYLVNPHLLVRRREYFRLMLANRVGRVVIDESSMMKNAGAKTTRLLHEDFGAIPERYCLSGSPAPNGDDEYWGQISFLRPGLLPLKHSEFLNTWFKNVYRDKWKIRNDSMKEELMRIIHSCSISIAKDDTGIDFPDKNFVIRHCELPEKPRNIAQAYRSIRDELKQELLEVKQNGERMGKLFTRIMKLRELTSGFLVTKDSSNNPVWNLVSTHKFEALEELLCELEGKPVLIFANFVEDFKSYARVLPHRAEKTGFIFGETNDPEYRENVIRAFKKGELPYLLVNPHSLQHGVTLFDPNLDVQCSDAVYFDLDYSLEAFIQSQDRIHRIGQKKHKINYYMLLCKGTIDEEIYKRLRDKREDFDDSMDFLK